MIEGRRAGKTHVFENLRQRLELAADLAQFLAGLHHGGQHFHRGDKSVAGRGVVAEHDMAGLFAADIEPVCPHVLDDVAVAHLRADEIQPEALDIFFKTEVGHHRRHHAAAAQTACRVPRFGDRRHQLVAVQQPAGFVGDQNPVGIAVERDPDIGAVFAHHAAHRAGIGTAAILVDVETVGLDAVGHDIGAEFPQRRRRDLVGGAVCAIDNDLQTVEAQAAREGVLDELDIAAFGVVQPLRAAEIFRLGQGGTHLRLNHVFDLLFGLIGQLVAIRPEELDTVILVRIVGGREHDPHIRPQRPGQHGHRRRRHGASDPNSPIRGCRRCRNTYVPLDTALPAYSFVISGTRRYSKELRRIHVPSFGRRCHEFSPDSAFRAIQTETAWRSAATS